jgi:endonuclease/exonuclease/phosphatase family metal-dependent hydrolase
VPLRVVTYNIHSCVGGDRRYDPERVLHVLRELDADLIALQEVGGLLTGGMEQIQFFEQKLGMSMVSGPNRHRRNIPFGNAILVKGQIQDMALLDLTILPFEARGAIDCVAETRMGPVRVIATHLGLLARERRKQIDRIADRLMERQQALTVLLGDFNIFGPERRVLRRIGAPKVLPKLYSFPARRPLMSLDRIWTIPNHRLVRLSVYRTALTRVASDHLPLIGVIDA